MYIYMNVCSFHLKFYVKQLIFHYICAYVFLKLTLVGVRSSTSYLCCQHADFDCYICEKYCIYKLIFSIFSTKVEFFYVIK